MTANNAAADETSALLDSDTNSNHAAPTPHPRLFRKLSPYWIPADHADVNGGSPVQRFSLSSSIRRRIFLLLTEPSTSIGSAIIFFILIVTITLSNIIMIMQTMEPWQFTPTDCVTCGGNVVYMLEDDATTPDDFSPGDCQCPPAPEEWTVTLTSWLVYFFSVEWGLRVLCFEPPALERKNSFIAFFREQWLGFLFEPTTILDALAIFPYYLERLGEQSRGLLTLRLLRLFRVFQLVRLGQYNATFQSFVNVMSKSLPYLRLLLVVLVFGSAFFGSILYWLEKGDWKYWEETDSYDFIRIGTDGVTEEISPFNSIPQTFWWFLVTATTVGYGDTYPTSTGGKCIAVLAMLTGVLVIAFPVSVFSDLWSKELTGKDQEKEEDGGTTNREQFVSKNVMMNVQDLAELRAHMTAMSESQKRIQAILEKYGMEQ